ncbi:MAG: hypothetical protein ACRC1Z_11400 [Waterburya sp.]
MPQFTITKLASDKDDSDVLQISAERVVWTDRREKESRDYDILLYDGSKIIKVNGTEIFYDGMGLSILGSGRNISVSGDKIVWAGHDSKGDSEIFFYNGKETIQLTHNDVDDFFPQLSGDNVVWCEIRRTYDSNNNPIRRSQIFLAQGQDIIQLTENDTSNILPQISGKNVVWVGIDSNNERQIFLYDGKETKKLFDNKNLDNSSCSNRDVSLDNSKVPIKSNNGGVRRFQDRVNDDTNNDYEDTNDCRPLISGNNVVWETKGNLFFYNGRKTIQLDDHDRYVAGSSVQISGDNVVWINYKNNYSRDDSEIFLYNGKETIQLTNNDVDDFFPQVSGDNVVWQREVLFNREEYLYQSEIFLYNGKETIRLTNNDVNDFLPQIDGNRIVWERASAVEKTTNIMLATLEDTKSSSTPPLDRGQEFVSSSMMIIFGLISCYLLKKLCLK